MISKSNVKLIKALERKKGRLEHGMFVGEGPKVVGDLLKAGFAAHMMVGTEHYWQKESIFSANSANKASTEFLTVTDEELRRVSFLQHPQEVLGVFETPISNAEDTLSMTRKSLCLALDGVQDPGNLGTIIRIADWFGIDAIVCSPGTADAFNPKVVQATMGSIARVPVVYTDLEKWLGRLPKETPIYGTVLDGDNIYQSSFSDCGVIVMGNEGNGISDSIKRRLTHRLFIPSYRADTAESLNVAVATAITCAEARRQKFRH